MEREKLYWLCLNAVIKLINIVTLRVILRKYIQVAIRQTIITNTLLLSLFSSSIYNGNFLLRKIKDSDQITHLLYIHNKASPSVREWRKPFLFLLVFVVEIKGFHSLETVDPSSSTHSSITITWRITPAWPPRSLVRSPLHTHTQRKNPVFTLCLKSHYRTRQCNPAELLEAVRFKPNCVVSWD